MIPRERNLSVYSGGEANGNFPSMWDGYKNDRRSAGLLRKYADIFWNFKVPNERNVNEMMEEMRGYLEQQANLLGTTQLDYTGRTGCVLLNEVKQLIDSNPGGAGPMATMNGDAYRLNVWGSPERYQEQWFRNQSTSSMVMLNPQQTGEPRIGVRTVGMKAHAYPFGGLQDSKIGWEVKMFLPGFLLEDWYGWNQVDQELTRSLHKTLDDADWLGAMSQVVIGNNNDARSVLKGILIELKQESSHMLATFERNLKQLKGYDKDRKIIMETMRAIMGINNLSAWHTVEQIYIKTKEMLDCRQRTRVLGRRNGGVETSRRVRNNY